MQSNFQGQPGTDQELTGDRDRLRNGIERIAEQRASRRSFLKNAAMVAGTSTAVLAGASTARAASGASTLPTLPYQKDANWVMNHFQDIINNELSHLSALKSELGVFARPAPTFMGLTVTTLSQYVTMGATFCGIGAGAYLGALPYVSNPYLMGQAASISQVELAQSSYLNTLNDLPFVAGGSPYGPPLTLQQVLNAAAPYVASLNGGPEPGFSTTDLGLDNDINIFNTALILEYLEVQFYTSNFQTIFGQPYATVS